MDGRNEMAAYDALPDDLRGWLSSGKRQFSAVEVLAYVRAGHSTKVILASLERAEQRLIERSDAERGFHG